MELYKQIMVELLSREEVTVNFSNMQISAKELLECVCFKALKEIKLILEDDTLEDEDCFITIEKIVRTFEDIGSDCRNRHDFG